MSSIISVHNLTKTFQVAQKDPGLQASIKSLIYRPTRTVTAVDHINFNIEEGELVGFIGPNGAGKTTTLKMLSGLLYPSSGEAQVLGYTPSRRQKEYLSQIAFVMGQKNQLWWDIPPQETFLLNKAIYQISDVDYHRRLDFLLSTLKVDKEISIPTRKLSLGQRMKCEFIAALLHQPKVVFLDEPTIGLDVVIQQRIRQFIRDYNREFRSAMILTSHNMRDVSELCARVIIIDNGRIYFDGQLTDLVSQYGGGKFLKFTFDSRVPLVQLKKYGTVSDYHQFKATIEVAKPLALKVASSILSKFSVVDLNIEEMPIEEVISQIFQSNNFKSNNINN